MRYSMCKASEKSVSRRVYYDFVSKKIETVVFLFGNVKFHIRIFWLGYLFESYVNASFKKLRHKKKKINK